MQELRKEGRLFADSGFLFSSSSFNILFFWRDFFYTYNWKKKHFLFSSNYNGILVSSD